MPRSSMLIAAVLLSLGFAQASLAAPEAPITSGEINSAADKIESNMKKALKMAPVNRAADFIAALDQIRNDIGSFQAKIATAVPKLESTTALRIEDMQANIDGLQTEIISLGQVASPDGALMRAADHLINWAQEQKRRIEVDKGNFHPLHVNEVLGLYDDFIVSMTNTKADITNLGGDFNAMSVRVRQHARYMAELALFGHAADVLKVYQGIIDDMRNIAKELDKRVPVVKPGEGFKS